MQDESASEPLRIAAFQALCSALETMEKHPVNLLLLRNIKNTQFSFDKKVAMVEWYFIEGKQLIQKPITFLLEQIFSQNDPFMKQVFYIVIQTWLLQQARPFYFQDSHLFYYEGNQYNSIKIDGDVENFINAFRDSFLILANDPLPLLRENLFAKHQAPPPSSTISDLTDNSLNQSQQKISSNEESDVRFSHINTATKSLILHQLRSISPPKTAGDKLTTLDEDAAIDIGENQEITYTPGNLFCKIELDLSEDKIISYAENIQKLMQDAANNCPKGDDRYVETAKGGIRVVYLEEKQAKKLVKKLCECLKIENPLVAAANNSFTVKVF